MIGWCADFGRLLLGLFYWNLRKSWYRFRRGRCSCPCQAQSDSGRAYETQCEACVQWNRPARFRRVCPLLVETPQGLRCSADAADVRSFWRRAAAYYGGGVLTLYLVGVIAIFAFLRTIGYPVSIFHVGLPPLWHRLGEARGWFFLNKSNLAFEQDRISEGLLYLTNAYEFDPTSYAAGLSLAKHLQAGQPARSDEIFLRLLREHPAKSHSTAQDWFRALLARGSFERIATLARDELLAGSSQSPVWIRALVFAARRLPSDRILQELSTHPSPTVQRWRPIFEVELLLRAGRNAGARAAIEAHWPDNSPGFSLFYRVNALTEMRDAFAALDLLGRYPSLLDAEAVITLRLDALAVGGMQRPLLQEVERLLAAPLTPTSLPVVKILCAHLIRYPSASVFERLTQKISRETIPLHTESAGVWFSLFCTAGAVGDRAKLHELTAQLKHASKRPFMALGAVEAFFRGETAERRITSFLPVLPLPLEVTYAMLARYLPPPATVLPATPL